ncbi:MAG TPA: DUF4142 domain-containing protein [Bryobacteraceae bacterium]|nr:DUF4142 domain-containing protein [Bryobacteraceae bacterium]
MKLTRQLLNTTLAIFASAAISASYGQVTPESQRPQPESNRPATGTANQRTNPTTDPTDTTTRTQQDRSGQKGTTSDSSRSRTTGSTGAGDMLTPADRKFMTQAAEGGLAEVALARMAQQKAESEAVKELARQIEQDHTKANAELKRIADMRNVQIPTEPPSTGNHKQVMDRLEKLSGAAFDKAYVRDMVKEHEKDIKMFEREANSGMDTELKTFASNTLPDLRKHLQMAQSAQSSVGARSGGNMSDKTSGTSNTPDSKSGNPGATSGTPSTRKP